MKKQIFYAVMMGLLLVACTTKNAPSSVEPLRIQGNGPLSIIDEYEELYETFKTTTIPAIMGLNNIDALLGGVIAGNTSASDITYESVANIVGAYYQNGSILELVNDALLENGFSLDLEDENVILDINLLDLLISDMQDSVYITSSYREQIFADETIGEYEKVLLCLRCAISNIIYEDLYSHTIVVHDTQYYFTMQFPEGNYLPVGWTLPCGICEISVENVSLFDTTNIAGTLSLYGNYIPFDSHAARLEYLADLDHDFTTYYVTIQECKEQRDEAMDELLTDIAFGVLMSVATTGGNIGMASIVGLVFYYAQKTQIDREYSACVETAEDNED